MSEKRTESRSRRRLVVTVDAHPWFTTDLGFGGFGAEASVLPIRGTRVVGLIRSGDVEVAFSGSVVWATKGNMNIGERSRAGVKFLHVGAALGKLLVAGEIDPLAAPLLVPRPVVRRVPAIEASGPAGRLR